MELLWCNVKVANPGNMLSPAMQRTLGQSKPAAGMTDFTCELECVTKGINASKTRYKMGPGLPQARSKQWLQTRFRKCAHAVTCELTTHQHYTADLRAQAMPLPVHCRAYPQAPQYAMHHGGKGKERAHEKSSLQTSSASKTPARTAEATR